MSKTLEWFPQTAFSDYFYTDANEVIKNRTVFKQDITYFVAEGGRGSAKSFTFMDALIVEGSIRPVRVLCTREIQGSIEESVKAELEAAIYSRGLENYYTIQKKVITAPNGTRFIFKGIKNNIKSLKSISDVDIVLYEEAENITKHSWEKVLPSIRPREPFGQREYRPIHIVIFNPDDELDDTYQRFVVNPPPRTITKKINWSDNKYFPENLNEMRLHSLRTRPKKDHEHDWEGKPKGAAPDVIIDRDWVRAARFASKKKGFKKVGPKSVAYDPAGQGRDSNAVVYADGNIISLIDEWVNSDNLREASERAYDHSVDNNADRFTYDTCGGLGDGVAVFVDDKKKLVIKDISERTGRNFKERRQDGIDLKKEKERIIFPFDAGSSVVDPDRPIPGTGKTWGEQYTNAKAQVHAITAQKLYNAYRFVILDEEVDPADMISIDIEDDEVFNNLVRELSCPLWVKSKTNSKKKVESKEDMEKRTGQKSPNIADGVHMCYAPMETKAKSGGWDW